MKKLLLAVVLAASAMACSKDEPQPIPSGEPYGYVKVVFEYSDGSSEESGIKPVYAP